MEKVINVDIKEMDDLVERYNEEIVSKDLINYILNQAKFINKKDNLKIIINQKFDFECDIIKMINKALNDLYLLNLKKSYINNIKQFIFLILGIICLILYGIVNNPIISEIILIGGWVLIWKMVDLFLFSDTQLKRDKMILRKLLKSDFVVNKKVIKD